MKEIKLTKGFVALVDDRDYAELSRHKWQAQENGRRVYATRNGHRLGDDGKRIRTKVYMHREIMGNALFHVDHRDGDGLNNQRSNLRLATRTENQGNVKIRSSNTSGYRGVSWEANARKWRAGIGRNGKRSYIGLFSSAEDAARAYDDAARQYFGEFATLNFPEGGQR